MRLEVGAEALRKGIRLLPSTMTTMWSIIARKYKTRQEWKEEREREKGRMTSWWICQQPESQAEDSPTPPVNCGPFCSSLSIPTVRLGIIVAGLLALRTTSTRLRLLRLQHAISKL